MAACADAGCRAAADWKEPAAQENGNTPKETTKGPRPEPDLLPEEHSESATRGLWLSGQRRTQVLLVSDVWDTLRED